MNWHDALEENGFAIAPPLVAADELEALTATFSCDSVLRSRAGVRHALKHSAVAAVAHSPNLVAVAKSVLGEGAFPYRATLFDKSAKANWLVPWHQDTALPLRERREEPGWGPWSVKDGVTYARAPVSALSQVVALRVHLDDSTRANGPLRVLPGTHGLGILEAAAIEELASKIPAVECEVAKGGVLAMRPLLVHASSKAQTRAPRRVLHIEYAACGSFGNGLELRVA